MYVPLDWEYKYWKIGRRHRYASYMLNLFALCTHFISQRTKQIE